ncbi:peptidoglycan-binding protein [Leptolyngbya sp. FACHB-36]|uniref:peptidoglycan-binding domain-containing protein n=1 Tax=Leptolyngbya sp. FACHB-36 TaxID=2692808 RepID=UPI001680E14A|nr:peptidoglycan-binding domain-containing protein [Leptolyngbya sp. FACHB-36]MBD2020390.1 peptidoglycan-binding protein [Leptolyngbya sp. FACHB-36]
MALTLADLKDNLDGLGYPFGPRGLFGVGSENQSCDPEVLGNVNCGVTSVRDLPFLDFYTKAAIYQFQVDNKLAATGEDGPALQDKVEQSVRILQNNLKIVLGRPLPITGRYRFETLSAVKDYQRSRRFPITGIATRPVRERLDLDARNIVGNPNPPNPNPPNPNPIDIRPQLRFLIEQRKRGVLTELQFIDELTRLAS